MAKLTEQNIKSMFCDPFYCLSSVHPQYTIDHRPLVTKKEWKNAAVMFIEDNGSEEFIDMLLENLQGNGSHWKS